MLYNTCWRPRTLQKWQAEYIAQTMHIVTQYIEPAYNNLQSLLISSCDLNTQDLLLEKQVQGEKPRCLQICI